MAERRQPELSMAHARDVAVHTACAAGSLILSRMRDEITVHEKAPDGDVVSNLDLVSEELIVKQLLTAFPGHQIETEESGVIGDNPDAVWVVDPLDGTSNVAAGLPIVAVGIVLCVNAVPTVGVIHEPITGRTCSAIRGHGVVFDDTGILATISRARDRDVAHPMLAWTQGRSVRSGDPAAVSYRLVLDRLSSRLIQGWAPLVAWAMLARGHIDGFVGYEAGSDDLHPGVLVATEAGVQVRDLDGRVFDERYYRNKQRSFVAAPEAVLPEILAVTRTAESVVGKLPPEVVREAESSVQGGPPSNAG